MTVGVVFQNSDQWKIIRKMNNVKRFSKIGESDVHFLRQRQWLSKRRILICDIFQKIREVRGGLTYLLLYTYYTIMIFISINRKNALNHNWQLLLAFPLLIYTFSCMSNYFLIRFNRVTYKICMTTIIAYHLYAIWVMLSYHRYSLRLLMINVIFYCRYERINRSSQLFRLIDRWRKYHFPSAFHYHQNVKCWDTSD
jgi:hypothetical protein